MIRRALVTAAAALAVVSCATPAHAAGWVANSCAVRQALHATMVGPHEVTGDGRAIRFIPCGTGLSNILYVTAGRYPYIVDPQGPPKPYCKQAGERYYPTANGAVLTPTVRCYS